MTKDEEIRMINEKLDFYVMEASDEEYMKELLHELQSQVSVLQNLWQPISYS